MSDGHEVTGERVIPEAMGGELIEAEHQARYQVAMPHVAGRSVLDAGCGGGGGSVLLARARAQRVVGVDLDQGKVNDAKHRAPDVEFVVADLLELPFRDRSFDVVVCFDTIEHTGDTAKALDELTRVLDSGGLLFVSAANPRVYPPSGVVNRVDETPEALLTEVQARFGNTRLIRQHSLVASLLLEGGNTASALPLAVDLRSVVPLLACHGRYSLIAASDAPLPDTMPLAMVAPSVQLNHIATLVGDVTAECEGRVRGMTADYERQAQELRRINAEDERELARLAADQDALTARLAELTAKRDAFAAMVLAAEQELAKARLQHATAIEELMSSTSWRVTEPLRRVSAKLRDSRRPR